MAVGRNLGPFPPNYTLGAYGLPVEMSPHVPLLPGQASRLATINPMVAKLIEQRLGGMATTPAETRIPTMADIGVLAGRPAPAGIGALAQGTRAGAAARAQDSLNVYEDILRLRDLLYEPAPQDTGDKWAYPLIAAGLGMAASSSPFPLQAVAEGGLAGLGVLQEQERAAKERAEKEREAKQKAIQLGAEMAMAKTEAERAAAEKARGEADIALRRKNLEQPSWDFQEDKDGKIWAINTKDPSQLMETGLTGKDTTQITAVRDKINLLQEAGLDTPENIQAAILGTPKEEASFAEKVAAAGYEVLLQESVMTRQPISKEQLDALAESSLYLAEQFSGKSTEDWPKDKSKLEVGKIYKLKDGSLVLWDGKNAIRQ